ncbi:DUF305 domain-containing protein [Nesterenkonia alkaliphila]|uniref:DUF305 domain-containing protein n=2 Tax=Nesterenkonia alkaliphila TaxID=1463631 RepID=A0A7K1UKT9_9MICC|nr:DUF305 domain-containing protein [Nesterenkonia alkaliphila]GFZ93895.1 hypothetical protein GCM10011359_24230 [Nesterenkonia alkaliphila]
MKKASLSTLAATTLMAIALTGCGSDPEEQQQDDTNSAEQTDDQVSDDFNDADVDYAAGMIVHHEQAIEMSDLLLAKTDIDPEVTELAEDIKEAQGPEIEQMTAWLEAWDQEDAGNGGHEGMDHGDMGDDDMGHGMMSEEDLADLEDAEGTDASRLFLEQMIMHHEGAVTMAEQHLEDGQNPEALDLSENVIADQSEEIEEMEQMLEEL